MTDDEWVAARLAEYPGMSEDRRAELSMLLWQPSDAEVIRLKRPTPARRQKGRNEQFTDNTPLAV